MTNISNDYIEFEIDDKNFEPLCGCLSDQDADLLSELIDEIIMDREISIKEIDTAFENAPYEVIMDLKPIIHGETLKKIHNKNLDHLNTLRQRLGNTPLCKNI